MNVSINRHALDRVPLSIIFDDSTMLVNHTGLKPGAKGNQAR